MNASCLPDDAGLWYSDLGKGLYKIEPKPQAKFTVEGYPLWVYESSLPI